MDKEKVGILIASPDPWNAPIPYHIAPQRIARSLVRAGHEVYNLDVYGDPYSSAGLPPNPPNIVFQLPWGSSIHATEEKYYEKLKTMVNLFNPDLAYLFGRQNHRKELGFFKNHGIPVGLHQADPYWNKFPSLRAINGLKLADFITCNEGQAWNYLRHHGFEGMVHLLSHAIDPELASPVGVEKRFMCSTVTGGEGPLRHKDLTEYYYRITDRFPEQTFIAGGGLWKNMRWQLDEYGEKQPYNHPQFTDQFNITKINDFNCKTFPRKENPSVLCHKFIHRLYSQSYYGFVPWGWYLREGPQSKYNTRTFGTKIFEMGGSGAAMLSCWIHDIEEVITEGKTGFILHSSKDTENAFQYAVDNPEEVRQMGEEAHKDIHKRHSWDVRYRSVLLPIFKDLGVL